MYVNMFIDDNYGIFLLGYLLLDLLHTSCPALPVCLSTPLILCFPAIVSYRFRHGLRQVCPVPGCLLSDRTTRLSHSLLSPPGCPVRAIPSWLLRLGCHDLAAYPSCPFLAVLSRLFHPGCSVLAAMTWQPIQAVPSWLSCPGYSILASPSWLAYMTWQPIQPVPSLLSCPGYSILAAPSWLP